MAVGDWLPYLAGTVRSGFKVGKATVDASGVASTRNVALRDGSGVLTLDQDAYIAASASAGALTISLKTMAGSDCTSSRPARLAFRSSTLTTGTTVDRVVDSALSLVIPSGATLGMTSARANKAWVLLVDDAGTPALAITNCANHSTGHIFPLCESMLVTTVAIDTAADSPGIIYSTSAITAKPIKILGWVQWSPLTAAGTYTTPDKIHPWSPGDKLPADTVADYEWDFDPASGTDAWPGDATVPTQSETFQAAAVSFATVEPTDAVEVTAWAFCSASAGQFPYAGIYYDSSSTPLDWQLVGGVNNSGAGGNSRLSKTWFPGTSSAVSYYYRWACQSGTVYVASYLGTNFCGERIRMKGRVIRS